MSAVRLKLRERASQTRGRIPRPAERWRAAWSDGWSVFWTSRLAVLGICLSVAIIGVPGIAPASNDVQALAHPFVDWPLGGVLDRLFSPLVRWDALHFLGVAVDGYSAGDPRYTFPEVRPAFFPVYPAAVRVLSGLAVDNGLVVIVSQLVALGSFLGALVLLARLVDVEVGRRFARPTLLLLAFFPMAFFFSAPYSESTFLALSVGAFLAARTGHWAVAGMVLAVASATRVPGLLLVVPIALIYLYGPRADCEQPPVRPGWRCALPLHRPRADILWLGLAPLGLGLFSLYLNHVLGDAGAWYSAQQSPLFDRVSVAPWKGVWEGAKATRPDLNALFAATPPGVPGPRYQVNLVAFLFLLGAAAAAVGVLRRLPIAYGVWVILGIVPALMSIRRGFPLFALPRFVVVLFPIFIWLALVLEPRGLTRRVAGGFALIMTLFTAAFVGWVFVA